MKFELFISLRYLMAKRKQSFISLITWISIGGVALGVMALIVVLSVMTGMQNELRDKILGTYSHIVVNQIGGKMPDDPEIVEVVTATAGVTAAAHYVYGEAMLSHGGRSSGTLIRGVEPDATGKVTSIKKYMLLGSVDYLKKTYKDGEFERHGIILGNALADSINADLGDVVTLINPRGKKTPFGRAPRVQKFLVVGLFSSGMYDYDSSLSIISKKAAQGFFAMKGRVSGIEVRVDDIYQAGEIAAVIQKKLGPPLIAKGWMELNKNFFYALKLEKTAIFIILVLIIFVAAFNIVSTMIMVVMEKGRDIAILRTMGATRRNIMRLFFLEGFIIGISGTIIGNILGFIFCILLKKYHFIQLPGDVYNVANLAVEMNMADFLLVSSCALTITILSSAYPAWNASRIDPAEALRYE